jgi:hypothetical protein
MSTRKAGLIWKNKNPAVPVEVTNFSDGSTISYFLIPGKVPFEKPRKDQLKPENDDVHS